MLMKKNVGISRRNFIGKTLAGSAAFTIVPGRVVSGLGYKAPSDKLNIAGIGVGGFGYRNLKNIIDENIVALCDVDWEYAEKTFSDFPSAKKYWDWRVLFDEMKDSIDAVIIATPDHTHAVIAATAMTMGKHVYVQKPLTHSVYESRLLTQLSKKYKVATQMGTQGSSEDGIRQICEWIWDGAIGEIREVHAWTNRPLWPQGLQRPTENMRIPKTLKWDLFLGPAPERPYNSAYTPWAWRGWWDFGTGALGDMACHILDPVFKALKLQYPDSVQASSTSFNLDSAPNAQVVKYRFPARYNLPKVAMPEVEVTWWDGGLLPPRPDELPSGEVMGKDENGGCLFIGSKGKMMCGTYGRNPFLLTSTYNDLNTQPPQKLERIKISHEMDWVRACKESQGSRNETSANFSYSGPLNEMVVMGVVAVRLQDLKRELLWDGNKMEFLNISENDEIKAVQSDKFKIINGHPEFDTQRKTIKAKEFATGLIKHNYRNGWSLPEL